MSDRVDVNRRVIWGRHKLHRKRLILTLAFCATCVFFFLVPETAPSIFGYKLDASLFMVLSGIGVAIGVAWSGYEFHGWLRGKALVELLPQGIIFRMPGIEHFIVPWHEIRGVDTIDIHATFRGRPVVFENVTVVLVSRFFYDRVIHIDSFILRGPGWEANFIPKGNLVQIALHDEVLPATSAEIRREVEARWKAFGSRTPAPEIAPAAARS